MSDFLKSVDKAVRDVQANSASVEVTTEKVEGAITHTGQSWAATAFIRKWLGRSGTPEAGGKITKSW